MVRIAPYGSNGGERVNVHFTLFVRRMMLHNSIGKYRHLVTWNLPWNGSSPLADQTSRIIAGWPGVMGYRPCFNT